MRGVVTEVAASTANIELPLWEAATVDGPGVGKMSTRTMEAENTVGWAALVPCCCCCWSAPVGFISKLTNICCPFWHFLVLFHLFSREKTEKGKSSLAAQQFKNF